MLYIFYGSIVKLGLRVSSIQLVSHWGHFLLDLPCTIKHANSKPEQFCRLKTLVCRRDDCSVHSSKKAFLSRYFVADIGAGF